MTPKLREGTSIGAFANSSQTMKLAAAVAPISLNSLQVTEKECQSEFNYLTVIRLINIIVTSGQFIVDQAH